MNKISQKPEKPAVSNVSVTFVANAGVMVSHKGVNLLVDGIHCEDGHPFCKVSSLDLHLMKTGMPPFAKLDYLLFSHEHPDHFTPRLVREYLQSRHVKGVFMPDYNNGSSELKLLAEEIRSHETTLLGLGLRPGEVKLVELGGGMSVTIIGTRHMGPQYQDIRNDCFMLSIGGVNILFTGDADHVAEYFAEPLQEVELDAVFVNPIFFHNRDGQKIINDIFRPRNVVIHHLPAQDNDPMNLWLTVERALNRYAKSGFETYVLHRERQKLHFGPTTY